jgi:UDP-N-acetylmuramoylalanine--D-glutamate ligase
VLAITGTNGKTTVTSLTGLLLQRAGLTGGRGGQHRSGPAGRAVGGAGRRSGRMAREAEARRRHRSRSQRRWPRKVVAGPHQRLNRRCAMPGAADVGEDADEDEWCRSTAEEDVEERTPALVPPPPEPQPPPPAQVWVLELSSFQLDGTGRWCLGPVPTAATVLNITEDHLDWHGSHGRLCAGQGGVFGTQALMLLNRDDDGHGHAAGHGDGQGRRPQPPAAGASLDQLRSGRTPAAR